MIVGGVESGCPKSSYCIYPHRDESISAVTSFLQTRSDDVVVVPDVSPWDAWGDVYLEWHDAIIDADGPFYRDLADRNRGHVIELGCGDGRLFDAVRPDVGLDTSTQMLERAAGHPANVDVTYGDIRDYKMVRPATFSYAAMNIMSHLPSIGDQDTALANVRANTAPGGVFAFDCLRTDPDEITRRNGQLQFRHRGDTWVVYSATLRTGGPMELEWHGIIDELDVDGIVTRRRHLPAVPLVPRLPQEWVDAATETGWTVLGHYGDFDATKAPLDAGWQTMVLINNS